MDESKNHVENMSEKGIDKQTKTRKEKVLVYDTEKGETTKCFIEVLKKLLVVFEFQDFQDANDEDKDSLSIIAVVRHTSIRVTETLCDVKEQLDKKKIKDLKRVFVIYFYVNKSDEECVHKIKQISESVQFNFGTIVTSSFISDSGLLNSINNAFGKKVQHKTDNKSLYTLKECIKSRKKLCVNAYGDVDLRRAKAFIEELAQYISSSFELQTVKPLKEPIDVTSPTLICTTGGVDECQKKLKEKGLRKGFLCHIIDFENRSNRRAMLDSSDAMEKTSVIPEEQDPSSTLSVDTGNNAAQKLENMPCEVYDIIDFDGTFKIDFALVKQFENFVRRWPGEIKPSSKKELASKKCTNQI